MHLKALKIFCDVVEHRSFSEAASDNGVSQSAASQMIHQLEEHLGTKLIDRSQRPIAILPPGELFYRGCRKITDQFQSLTNQLRDVVAAESGQVGVASIYSVGLSHLNCFLKEFLAGSPQSNVRVEYQHPEQVYELVERGQVQLGLVSYARDSRSIEATAWRNEQIVAVCSPEHPLAVRDEMRLSDFHGREFVGYDQRLRICTEIDRALAGAGVETNVVMRFDNTETIKRALEIGAGIGLLPAPTLKREVASGTLVQIPLEPPGLVRPVCIIRRRGKELPPDASRFVQFLLEHASADHEDEKSASKAAMSTAD